MKKTCTSGFRDLLLGKLGEVLGLHNNGDLDLAVSEKLEIPLGDKVNHRSLSSGSTLGSLIDTLSSNAEELVEIESRGVFAVLQFVELTHTNLSEVTRVIFVHEDTVVVLSSGVTATTRMLTVLSDTTVSHRDVAALLA